MVIVTLIRDPLQQSFGMCSSTGRGGERGEVDGDYTLMATIVMAAVAMVMAMVVRWWQGGHEVVGEKITLWHLTGDVWMPGFTSKQLASHRCRAEGMSFLDVDPGLPR